MPTEPRAEPLSEEEKKNICNIDYWSLRGVIDRQGREIDRLWQENEVLKGKLEDAIDAVAHAKHGPSGLCCQLRNQELNRADRLQSENEALRQRTEAAAYQMRTCTNCRRSSALGILETKP